MTETAVESRSIVVQREMPHPPEKIWRAMTQSALIEDWLMQNDFKPVRGHRFTFRMPPMAGWNGVTDCEVLEVEPPHRLAYTWNASGDEAATGMKTVVTLTLTPTDRGALVRMEQSGFRPQHENNRRGAAAGWQRFLEGLERVAGGLD